MSTPIVTESCPHCQRRQAILNAYAEQLTSTEYDLETVQGYLSSALKVIIDRDRALDTQQLWNRILNDENRWLRETLRTERDIRSESDEPQGLAA